MDALSDVLRVVQLTGGVFLEAEFTAPWCVWSRVGPEDCQPFLVTPRHLLAYHCVLEGTMIVGLDDGNLPVELGAGGVVLLPRNPRHRVGSSLDIEPILADDLVQSPVDGGLARIAHGGGGALTRFVCGFLGCDAPFNPLLSALPEALTLDLRGTPAGAWMESSFRFAATQRGISPPGDMAVTTRLSELLFVEALRHYLGRLPADERGWLAGLRDPVVGRALALMHGGFSQPWTTESLAQAVNLSRSAFAERFTGLVGRPPMQYLTEWRLLRAGKQLKESPRSVAQVAADVGYESEAAFSRAFKRHHGVSPAAWRKSARS
jgi:AraC-like DNA-binding protein